MEGVALANASTALEVWCGTYRRLEAFLAPLGQRRRVYLVRGYDQEDPWDHLM